MDLDRGYMRRFCFTVRGLISLSRKLEAPVSATETEAGDGQALMLFLQHYLSLAQEGIDVSELQHLEEQLSELNNLNTEDFLL